MQAIPGGALVDGSGELVEGGTSEEVFAANIGRQYLLIMNLDAEKPLWVQFGDEASEDIPSIRLVAGAALEFSISGTGVVPTASVNVVGDTTGHKYVAKEA